MDDDDEDTEADLEVILWEKFTIHRICSIMKEINLWEPSNLLFHSQDIMIKCSRVKNGLTNFQMIISSQFNLCQ